METVFEFIFELAAELIGEGINSERLPKFLRYLLLTVLCLPLLAIFVIGAITAEDTFLSVFLYALAIGLLALFGFAVYRMNRYGLFRQAAKEDLPGILKLYRSVIGRPGCTWNVFYPNETDLQADFQAECLYTLKKGNALIGAGSIVPQNELDDLECWGIRENARELARIVIAPECQGKGFGKHLLSMLCYRLERTDCKAVHLLVSTENHHALNLYREAGFQNKGKCTRYGREYYAYEKKL